MFGFHFYILIYAHNDQILEKRSRANVMIFMPRPYRQICHLILASSSPVIKYHMYKLMNNFRFSAAWYLLRDDVLTISAFSAVSSFSSRPLILSRPTYGSRIIRFSKRFYILCILQIIDHCFNMLWGVQSIISVVIDRLKTYQPSLTYSLLVENVCHILEFRLWRPVLQNIFYFRFVFQNEIEIIIIKYKLKFLIIWMDFDTLQVSKKVILWRTFLDIYNLSKSIRYTILFRRSSPSEKFRF